MSGNPAIDFSLTQKQRLKNLETILGWLNQPTGEPE